MVNREDIIKDNLGLVHSLVKRFVNRGIEYDDLYQSGCVGLIKAVDNFDESRGFAFSTYAVPVILGEIKRQFRDGGAIKVSRSLKEKSLIVQKAREAFAVKHFREPTLSELSEITGISKEDLTEILEILTPVQSLSDFYEDENKDIDVPTDNSDIVFNRLIIHEASSKLSVEDRYIIYQRYFKEKTQSETAKLLGLSQVQISRREKRILAKLRKYIN
ncbi:MAG: sigma-70 family RNA polymerase sigma factor [Eubacterium sp.]|nr:sigma-70 family RNA polymerase sigma factor [Eubacterium sp.]